MAAAIPVLPFAVADQAEVRLVDQGRGLQRLPRFLVGQPLGRQLPQFVIDQRQELAGGVPVARLDGREGGGNPSHGDTPGLNPAWEDPGPSLSVNFGIFDSRNRQTGCAGR
jgi:hypothetical protein